MQKKSGYATFISSVPQKELEEAEIILPDKPKGVRIGTWVAEAAKYLQQQGAEIIALARHLAPEANMQLADSAAVFPALISTARPILFVGYEGDLNVEVLKYGDVSYGRSTPQGAGAPYHGKTLVNQNNGSDYYDLVPRRAVVEKDSRKMHLAKGVLVTLYWVAVSRKEAQLRISVTPSGLGKDMNLPNTFRRAEVPVEKTQEVETAPQVPATNSNDFVLFQQFLQFRKLMAAVKQK